MAAQQRYPTRQYAVGELLLNLRSRAQLTQTELAQGIGVSRRGLQKWENGESYPNAQNLRALITFLVSRAVFPQGQEREAAAHLWEQVSDYSPQPLPFFDTTWFDHLLTAPPPTTVDALSPTTSLSLAQADTGHDRSRQSATDPAITTTPVEPPRAQRIDWGYAPDVPVLYGRTEELETLTRWVLTDRCHLITLMGLGGVGKTCLVVTFARQVAAHFDKVVFRSLGEAPPFEELIDQLLHSLAAGQPIVTTQRSTKLALLINLLREQRCLLILDNLETLRQAGTLDAHYLHNYEEYGTLFKAIGETAHQSCLILTSRERLAELTRLEGPRLPVRSLRITGLSEAGCWALLAEQELTGTPVDAAALGRRFDGNPLALKLVVEPIRALFGGNVAAFLAEGSLFFTDVAPLLAQQIGRASPLEQTLLTWLAIAREPVALNQLLTDLVKGVSRAEALAALQALWRRNLIERGQAMLTFTLQRVILEYLTERLVEHTVDEILQAHSLPIAPPPEAGGAILPAHHLLRYALVHATAKDYVRRSQERLIAQPILEQLSRAYSEPEGIAQQLLSVLAGLRTLPLPQQGYGPGNLLNLLRLLRGHLRKLDLTGLAIRQAVLQGVEMQDAALAGVLIQDSVFTETFGAMSSVTISRNGAYWAASSRRGEVLVWAAQGGELPADETNSTADSQPMTIPGALHRTWQAHADTIWALTFSPDGRTLATSGNWEGTIKLWEVATGDLLWSSKHASQVLGMAVAPVGNRLASCSNDATVRLWDLASGRQLQLLQHPVSVPSVAWSPDGQWLASGDIEGTIRLWSIRDDAQAVCCQIIADHTDWVHDLAFAPDGHTLASASWDGTIKLWKIALAATAAELLVSLRQCLTGPIDRVARVAWSPDGHTLASSGREPTVWLWDVEQGTARLTLQGHTDGVYGITFTPDGSRLLSASEDGTLRVWDVNSDQCLRVLQGYAASLYDVDWSPDSTQVISGGTDKLVTLYPLDQATPPRLLDGHNGIVLGVGWSPQGHWVASSEWDNAVWLWDAERRVPIQRIHHPDDPSNYFSALRWSPDGQWLACGTYRQGILVVEIATQRLYWLAHGRQSWIRSLAWSADSTLVAGGDDHGTVYVWQAATGTLRQASAGHYSFITGLAWSPIEVDGGIRLASGGRGKDGGELLIWDPVSGQQLAAITDHPAIVCALAWGAANADSEIVISGDSDGKLRWWDIQQKRCMRVCEAHQGAVQSLRRSPDGTKLASCGDDGAVRLWDLRHGTYLQTLRRDRPYERMNITGLTGITAAQRASLLALGAIDRANTP